MSIQSFLKPNFYDIYAGSLSADSIDVGSINAGVVTATGTFNAPSIIAPVISGGSVTASGFYCEPKSSVTQLTSSSTAVSINSRCFQVITYAATNATGASVSFTVNNNRVLSTDYVFLQVEYAGTGEVYVQITTILNNSFVVVIKNISTTAPLNAELIIRCLLL